MPIDKRFRQRIPLFKTIIDSRALESALLPCRIPWCSVSQKTSTFPRNVPDSLPRTPFRPWASIPPAATVASPGRARSLASSSQTGHFQNCLSMRPSSCLSNRKNDTHMDTCHRESIPYFAAFRQGGIVCSKLALDGDLMVANPRFDASFPRSNISRILMRDFILGKRSSRRRVVDAHSWHQ
jgi:hypothetical protein